MKWGERLEAALTRLDATLEDLSADERDWAPDLGIGSAVEHVLQIAISARRLRRRLEASFESVRVDEGSLRPDYTETLLMLKSCHTSILGQLKDGSAFSNGNTPAAEDREEFIFEHLSAMAHHLACVALLQQLIDPSRQSALECGPPILV